MPAGRPSEYKPEYKQEIVRLMETGLSLTAAAASLGYVKQTIYNWGKSDPEFMDAITLGHGKRTLFLEKRLLSADTGPVVTSSIFALKNAAPDEWRDRVHNEHSGPGGGPIEQKTTIDAPQELARWIAFTMAKAAHDAESE